MGVGQAVTASPEVVAAWWPSWVAAGLFSVFEAACSSVAVAALISWAPAAPADSDAPSSDLG